MNHRSFAAALVGLGLLAFSPLANAACPSPFVAKDGGGTSQNLATVNDASNNCDFVNVIGDGGGAANKAAVKAASTAPVAGDPALVVGISPNSPALAVTPASNASVNLNQVGGSAVVFGIAGVQEVEQGCAGQTVVNTSVTPFDTNGGSTSIQLVAGVSAKKVYICSIDVIVGAADNVALVEGTGTLCATSTTGMAGGPTAARGWNLPANGGLTKGNGQGVLYKTATAADAVCLLFSASAQASGTITWAQF